MISERDISEKFSAIWKQHFPLLTPNFIRVFNEAQVYPINSKQVITLEDVRYDLVSEVAFNLSDLAYLTKSQPSAAIADEKSKENNRRNCKEYMEIRQLFRK